jgi:hypothetical protein
VLRLFAIVVLASLVGCASLEGRDFGFYPSLVDPAPTAWLDVAAPGDHVAVRRIASFIEVSGRAGFRELVDHDVVVVIDTSTSTFLPTERDVDGDGTVGQYRNWVPRVRHGYRPLRSWTTDFDDTILQAELRAAAQLLAGLDDESSRAGIVTFGERARVSVKLGNPSKAAAALAKLRTPRTGQETDFGTAIESALRILAEGQEGGTSSRHRSIILMSDGLPTAPQPVSRAKAKALYFADLAHEAGVELQAFAFGPRPEGRTFFEQLARRTGGSFLWVENSRRFADHLLKVLPYTLVPGIETVVIENQSNEQLANALRIFADGSFDGYVPLVDGENRIEVVATLQGGEELREALTVFYEKPTEPTRAEIKAAEGLRDKLRNRRIESELAAEAMNARRSRRELTIEAEEAVAPSGMPLQLQ